MKQSSDIVRRNPAQIRAITTIDTFFEATARILESSDSAKLTTNHIAERAGFSIGTLYAYFPNKRSLLQAMAVREAQKQEALVLHALELAGPGYTAEDLVRIVVRAVLRPFGGRNKLRLAMMRLLARDVEVVAAASAAQSHVLNVLLREIVARTSGEISMPRADTCFILQAAVCGAVQAAATERIHIFETQSFEDDIVRLFLSSLEKR
jgi:AcrR family transcriptional regulator